MPFNRVRSLKDPLFSLKHKPHMFVEVAGELQRIEVGFLSKADDRKIDVLPVYDLETGEFGMLIAGSVLVGVVTAMKVQQGQKLELEDKGIPEGKQYRDIRVWEIEY